MQLQSDIITGGPQWEPTETPVLQGIIGLMRSYKTREVDNKNIMWGDKLVLVDATFQPTTKMWLIDKNITYSIEDVEEVEPGMLSVIYRIQARV